MEFTADQQNTANQLHNSVGWVYPDLSNTDFWSQYFNPTPTLTADEQSTGISIGPADSNYYSRALRQPSVLPSANESYPITVGPTPNTSPISFQPTSGTTTGTTQTPMTVGQGGAGGSGSVYGGGDYESNLIRSLRQDFTSAPQAPGVFLRPNKANYSGIDFESDGTGSGLGVIPTISLDGTKTGGTNVKNAASYDLSTQSGVNDWYGSLLNEGYTFEELNNLANREGLTEQNVFDARKDWFGTPEGQGYIDSLEAPLQDEWALTFLAGDMAGAQDLINANDISYEDLLNTYNVSQGEINDVRERYGITPDDYADYSAFVDLAPDATIESMGYSTKPADIAAAYNEALDAGASKDQFTQFARDLGYTEAQLAAAFNLFDRATSVPTPDPYASGP